VAQVTHAGILDRVLRARSLFALFSFVPLIEVVLFIVVGNEIGVGPTILFVVLTAVIGAALVVRQGRATMASAHNDLLEGRFPGRAIAHGVMILIAGALLLTPGFFTDAVGFAFLVPAVREAVRRWVMSRYRPDQIITL
jgi:UPF0716 protein FxsA